MRFLEPKRISGRDAGIAELIEYFDADERVGRWDLLTDKELEIIEGEATRCKEHFSYAARNYFSMVNKRREEKIFEFWESQMLILDRLQQLQDRRRPGKILVVKARQLGASLLLEMLVAWKSMFFQNTNSAVVSYDPDHSAYLFSLMQYVYDRMPWWLRPMCSSREFKNGLVFENPSYEDRRKNPGLNSRITVQSANKLTGVGQGIKINVFHGCLVPSTAIHLADGTVKPICDVEPGDLVVTSEARVASVKHRFLSGKSNEETAKIRLWGNNSWLETTLDHKILTPGGWVEAQHIQPNDKVRFSVRPIEENQRALEVWQYAIGGDWKKPKPVQSELVPVDYALGQYLGWYLAEGSLKKTKRGGKDYGYQSVYFSVHRNEVDYIKSIILAIDKNANIRIENAKGSLTSNVIHNSRRFARLVSEVCSVTDTKHFPAFAWSSGRDFLAGLVDGMWDGDGNIGSTAERRVKFTTVRHAMALDMRMAMASLGYGWCAMKSREAGRRYGRNCKKVWIVEALGRTFDSYMKVRGIPTWLKRQAGQDAVQRWEWAENGKFIDIKVKEVGRGFSATFWDLEIDAAEHSFQTEHCVVKNSEVGDWANAAEVIDGDLVNALVEDWDTIAALESTAKGSGNYFHRLWLRNVELGESAEWHPIFMPWFFEATRVLAPPGGWRPKPEELQMQQQVEMEWLRCSNPTCKQYHERLFRDRDRSGSVCPTCTNGFLVAYKLSPDQMFWREVKRLNSDRDEVSAKLLKQEMATTATDAFQSSGYTLFPEVCQSFVQQTVREPRLKGHFDGKDQFHAIHPVTLQCVLNGCGADHYADGRDVWIWELPDPNSEYVMGADVAEGLGGPDSDFSVAVVLRLGKNGAPDRQVAKFRSNTTSPIEFAYMMKSLGKWYNTAMIAVELNKYDIAAGTLRFNLQYPNLYRWKALDATNILTNKFGWVTNQVTKPRLYQTFIRYLKANMVIIRSKNCSEEMKTFQKEDMQSRAAEAALGAFDDELMATMIALYCGHEAEYDDNLGYQPFSKRVTLDNAPWIMSCGACGEKWGQEAPNERVNCPKCNSIRIYGQKNSDFVKDEMKETITDELFDPPESSFAKEYELL
jgi:hypothetical protein